MVKAFAVLSPPPLEPLMRVSKDHVAFLHTLPNQELVPISPQWSLSV
jgi:hypothetical protein